MVRPQPAEDFGIDFEAELAEPEITGQFLKIQVKSSQNARFVGANLVYRVERQLLEYVDSCRVPVILVVVDLSKQAAWYLWLQEWVFSLNASGKRVSNLPNSISIHIPKSNELGRGLSGPLKAIASWKTKIQIALSLNDALRTAIALESDATCLGIFHVLRRIHEQYEDFPIDSVIAEVLRLGGQIWATEDGNRLSRLLFTICETYGERFKAKQIRQIVVRGDAYSRIGIIALGLLYDFFPKRMKKLKLQKLFKRDDPRVLYYCKFRERYLGKSSIEIVGRRNVNYAIDGWNLDEGVRDEILNKWANRGDSAILDYLVLKKRSPTKVSVKGAANNDK